jgi:glycosyltransferase involved in cell wall biosynthesis
VLKDKLKFLVDPREEGLNHFTIVTVVKNDLPGLKRSRASLEMQKYKKWLHIIVDGGSTDGTLSYLKKLPKENTLFISEPDNGIYDAMNKAWKLAQDDSFVFYLNARDEMTDPSSLSHASQALKASPNSNWGCTTHEEAFEDGSGWVCKLVSTPSIANQLYAFGYRSHQGVIMRKSLIEKLGGFDESYKIAADWDLIVQALLNSYPALWCQPMAKFELGGVSSRNMMDAHKELNHLRKKYLIRTNREKFWNYIWMGTYLRIFGYQNIFSRVIAYYEKFLRRNHPIGGSEPGFYILDFIFLKIYLKRIRLTSLFTSRVIRSNPVKRIYQKILSREQLNRNLGLNPLSKP